MKLIQKKSGGNFWGWKYVAIGAVLNGFATGFFGRGSSLYFLPLSREMGLTRTQTSLIFGAATVESGIQSPITGYFIDRIGPRMMMILGSCLSGIGFLVLPLSSGFIDFILIFVALISVGMNAGFHNGASAVVVRWFDIYRGRAFGYISAGIAVGGLVITPILAVMINNFGWRFGALFSGIMILAICVPISFLIKDSPHLVNQDVDGKNISNSKIKRQINFVNQKNYSFRSAISTFNYWLLACAIALRISAQAGVLIHLVPILVWKNFEEELGGITIAFISASAIFTRVLMGWLGDKIEKRIIVSVSMLVGMLACIIFLFGPVTVWTVLFFSLLISITDGAAGLTWAMIGDFFGTKSFATLRGVINLVVSVGAFVVPVMMGRIYDVTNSYHSALIGISLIYLVTSVLFLCILPPKPTVNDNKNN
ncbi:MAG: MFS transporter [SAR202 cluster bacterium]|nr:MFS transporter [SAR202 cluster bacterium]|tara:strand:- start:9333 stop:10604 length:1272 start_codon:yes stop_codon:yes gene_type:complete